MNFNLVKNIYIFSDIKILIQIFFYIDLSSEDDSEDDEWEVEPYGKDSYWV